MQELRSDLRRGLSRLAGPFPMEVSVELNAGREEVAFQTALTHMQAVSTQAPQPRSKSHAVVNIALQHITSIPWPSFVTALAA